MLTYFKNKSPKEFYTSERCHITELLNDEASPKLSIALCRVEPGITTQLHSLADVAETYFIMAGTGIMNDGKGAGITFAPGDSIKIPPNHPQRIANTGQTDLIISLTCTPRFTLECYINLED